MKRYLKKGMAFRKPLSITAREVYEDMLPDLCEGRNSFAWARCPFHNDNNPSFCVNLDSGYYRCHSSHCGVTGSNIVGFVGNLHGSSYTEARKDLESHYG